MSDESMVMRSMLKALIIGLILPICIIIGLFSGWIIGKEMGGIMEPLITLIGGIGGLILGSFLILKLLLRGERIEGK